MPRGRTPKTPATRQRRNKAATARSLTSNPKVRKPKLPEGRDWHDRTAEWWADIWASPMAPEFLDADIHGLYLLAELMDDFHSAKSPTMRKDLAGEIRLQRVCFGLTPIDRRRLQWEVGRVEEAQTKRQRKEAPASQKGDVYGPLKAVK